METHSSIFAWEVPRTEEPGGYSPGDRKESDATEHAHTHVRRIYRIMLVSTFIDCTPFNLIIKYHLCILCWTLYPCLF